MSRRLHLRWALALTVLLGAFPPAKAQIKSIGVNELEELLLVPEEGVHVVNFWATWCKPCIEELPAFEQLHQVYKDKGVHVVLVSLDTPDRFESGKLEAFVGKKGYTAEVIWMSEVDFNAWIPKVDPAWSGAIPATLMVGNGTRRFDEKSFTYAELEAAILPFLSK